MTWTDISLRIPNISALTDEELDGYFPQLDGRWSEQSRALVAENSATGLDLNSNWALIRRFWFCPCCFRYKPDLVRKADNGILIARLEVHHDHMREATKRMFTERFGNPRNLPVEALHAENTCVALVQRFPEVMICVDCNTADGHVKTKLAGELPQDFSFRPSEIGAFIRCAPNRSHEVDLNKAREIWNAQRADFSARFELIRLIMDRLEVGELRRERTGFDLHMSGYVLQKNWLIGRAFEDATRNSPERRLGDSAYWDYIGRSTCNDGAGLRSSLKPRRPAQAPSDRAFEETDQSRMASSAWRGAGAGWRCHCCGRSKREICRKANSGKWTASIQHAHDYVPEVNPTSIQLRRELYPAFAADPMFGDFVQYTLCQDCAAISAQLKARRPDITDVYLSVEDLRELIGQPEANRNHERDFDAAARRAIENLPLVDAARAFEEHSSVSGCALGYYNFARKEMNDAESRAYAATRLERERGWPERRLAPFIDWLLEEGARLRYDRDH